MRDLRLNHDIPFYEDPRFYERIKEGAFYESLLGLMLANLLDPIEVFDMEFVGKTKAMEIYRSGQNYKLLKRKDIIIPALGIWVECKSKPDYFNSPGNFPYKTVYNTPLRNWQAWDPKPFAIITFSQCTLGAVVSYSSDWEQWNTKDVKDRNRPDELDENGKKRNIRKTLEAPRSSLYDYFDFERRILAYAKDKKSKGEMGTLDNPGLLLENWEREEMVRVWPNNHK